VNHLLIAPVALPLATAIVLVLIGRQRMRRALSVAATAALLILDFLLLDLAAGGVHHVYQLGNWPAPFGIVLVLDRLSALMLALTAFIGLASVLYAVRDWDIRGRNFHVFFQFQLMGLNGAFLTGDLFNLFVFFEVLLIASYGLLLHGRGLARLTSGIHYVVFNLSASMLFLISLALLYGITGTLNMADMALKVAAADPGDAALIRAGALLLLVVFSVKAALLPLYFWLPQTYSSASAPVAALFSVLTKVGVYCILRVYTLIFGNDAGIAAGVATPWVLPAALATLAVATMGALASRNLERLVAFLLVASVGTMLCAVGLFSEEGIAAALFYLPHSALVLAALFLIVDMIAEQRGKTNSELKSAPPVKQQALLATAFLVAAAGVSGVPPLTGFLGKLQLLQSALASDSARWIYGIVLGTGLMTLIALAQAGSTVFWRTNAEVTSARVAHPLEYGPAFMLLAAILALSVFAASAREYMQETAKQVLDSKSYVDSVVGGALGGAACNPTYSC
jgi:multicomponent K+:H+ antiporter subunit D